MPEFRTASGLVSCTPMIRTGAGLVAADLRFFGSSGPVNAGGGATVTADFTPGAQTSQKLGNTGNYINRRTLSAQASGGAAPYRYLFEIIAESVGGEASIGNADTPDATLSTTSASGANNINNVTIQLTVTDAASRTASIIRDVTITSN